MEQAFQTIARNALKQVWVWPSALLWPSRYNCKWNHWTMIGSSTDTFPQTGIIPVKQAIATLRKPVFRGKGELNTLDTGISVSPFPNLEKPTCSPVCRIAKCPLKRNCSPDLVPFKLRQGSALLFQAPKIERQLLQVGSVDVDPYNASAALVTSSGSKFL